VIRVKSGGHISASNKHLITASNNIYIDSRGRIDVYLSKIKRKNRKINYMRKSAGLYLLLILLLAVVRVSQTDASTYPVSEQRILFPHAFAIAIDDLGWMEGSSLGEIGGPWRAGVRRSFDVRDYKPIVEIGQAVGVRFQGLFILGELDRFGIVAKKCPTASQFGAAVDNSRNIGPRQIEIIEYIKANAAHFEFGLHGVGHEYWVDGKRTRAEWYDLENDTPRDETIARNTLECFSDIMAQYGISPENGHSNPESFVPCAYGYYWNPSGAYSTGKIMSDFGIKYVNTLFSYIPELNPPPKGGGGFDNGVIVIDRINYGNPWYELASLPREPLEAYETDIIETHWPNLLAADDFLQPALNEKWIEYFKDVQAHPNHYLAKNTEQFYSQWLYKRHTLVEEDVPGKVTIDNRSMPEEAYRLDMAGNLVLTVPLGRNQHISNAHLDGAPVAAYFEDGGYGYIYLPPLERKVYEFEYEIGSTPMKRYVNNTGTYNVYSFFDSGPEMRIDIKMYGLQDVEIRTTAPKSVVSLNEHLKIESQRYDADRGVLILSVNGRNIQGERGTITLNY
jgi:hypothetical protein